MTVAPVVPIIMRHLSPSLTQTRLLLQAAELRPWSRTDWSLRLRKRTQRPPAPAASVGWSAPAPAKRRRAATSAERRRRDRSAAKSAPAPEPEPEQRPHINALPEEVLLYLLSHLNVPDRVRVRAGRWLLCLASWR